MEGFFRSDVAREKTVKCSSKRAPAVHYSGNHHNNVRIGTRSKQLVREASDGSIGVTAQKCTCHMEAPAMLRGGRARTLPVHEQPTLLRGFVASSYVGSQMDAQASMGL